MTYEHVCVWCALREAEGGKELLAHQVGFINILLQYIDPLQREREGEGEGGREERRERENERHCITS